MALTRTEHMSEAAYREFALGDPQGQWELHQGQLWERPGMSVGHGRVMHRLLAQLYSQIDPITYILRTQHAQLRLSSDTYYVPDVAVIPATIEQALYENPRALDAYSEPLPLVIEVWSPSTGGYDINAKMPDYQQRGDLEIWYIHPYERTLTVWRKQPNGAYAETLHRNETVLPASLPGVAIDLDALFAS